MIICFTLYSFTILLNIFNGRMLITISKSAETKSSASLNFNVIEVNEISEAENCQILFITKSKSEHLSEYSTALNGQPVLIVTEEEGLIEKGSGINFITVDGKLNIELNKNAIENSGLKVSSQLIALATVI